MSTSMNGDDGEADPGYDDDPTAGASDIGGRAGEPDDDDEDGDRAPTRS